MEINVSESMLGFSAWQAGELEWVDELHAKKDEIVRVGRRILREPMHSTHFYRKDIHKQTLDVQLLQSPCIVDLRAGENYLPLKALQYFKKQGNRIQFFIHGFNVPFGHFGCDGKTVLRADGLPQGATGMHEWLVCMEDNMNRATGKFHRSNYTQFKRLCHVAWPSTCKHYTDYMAIPARADKAGNDLFTTIKQCIKHNMEIEIITHSLGAKVCLSLLACLVENKLMEKIDRVFLWEAAVPDNCFEKQPALLKAVKECIILYSHHDDVLGDGPYYAAQLFQKPMSYFIESREHRKIFYKKITGRDLNAAIHHPVLRDTFNFVYDLYYPHATKSIKQLFSRDMVAITEALLNHKSIHPRPPLGLCGSTLKHPKIIEVDQSAYLHSHSGMKHPSETMLQQVYARFWSHHV